MPDNLRIPQRLEGEQEVGETPADWTGIDSLNEISLAAVIQILLKRGLCTEAELFAEEQRRRALTETAGETTDSFHFTPVQTHSERIRHRRQDSNRMRRWTGKRQWSRKIGTLLFGWKWHRKKNNSSI